MQASNARNRNRIRKFTHKKIKDYILDRPYCTPAFGFSLDLYTLGTWPPEELYKPLLEEHQKWQKTFPYISVAPSKRGREFKQVDFGNAVC